MNLKTIIVILLSLAISNLFGQETETKVKKIIKEEGIEISQDIDVSVEDGKKKVVIIKKDGNSEEVIEWEGSEDEEMPAEVKAALEEANLQPEQAEVRKKMKMIVIDEDGNEKIMEWDGTGEMPAEFKSKMEEFDLEDEGPQKKMRMKTIDADGEEKIIEWDGKGEMPAEMKKHKHQMHKEGHGMHKRGKTGRAPKFNGRGYDHKYGKRAKLGVEIEESAAGVVVNDVISGSAAEVAGIQKGDIFSEVDDTTIDHMDRLFAELATHNPGDQIKVKVLRKGSVKKMTVSLQ